MEQKTLGQVAYEKRFGDASAGGWDCLNRRFREAWEEAALAVVVAHEARKWRPIGTIPSRGRAIIGYWEGDEWVETMWRCECGVKPFSEYTHWTQPPAAPEAPMYIPTPTADELHALCRKFANSDEPFTNEEWIVIAACVSCMCILQILHDDGCGMPTVTKRDDGKPDSLVEALLKIELIEKEATNADQG